MMVRAVLHCNFKTPPSPASRCCPSLPPSAGRRRRQSARRSAPSAPPARPRTCALPHHSRPPPMGTPRIVPPERPTQHPTVALELSEADLRFGDDKCDLYVLLQLPPALFLDPYQLATTVSTTVPSTPWSPPAAYASVDIFGQAAPASDMRQPIELEKAVGWTDPDGARRRHAQAQSRPRQHHHHHHHAASYTRSTHMAPARSAGLEKEFTLNVLRIGVSSGTDAGERSFNTTHMLDLPLQARYLPPLPSRPPSTWRGWWNVIRLRNYDRVQLPKPQLMYSCLDDGGPEIAKDEWEYSGACISSISRICHETSAEPDAAACQSRVLCSPPNGHCSLRTSIHSPTRSAISSCSPILRGVRGHGRSASRAATSRCTSLCSSLRWQQAL